MPSLPRSLPRICVALGLPTPSELSRAAEREYKDGSTFFEFRLDYLPNPAGGIEVIRTFHRKYPEIRILATCRHRQAQGRFAGTIQQQIAILQDAGKAAPPLSTSKLNPRSAPSPRFPHYVILCRCSSLITISKTLPRSTLCYAGWFASRPTLTKS